MSTSSKSISSIQVGKRFSLRQGTAWFFMQKVRMAMKSSQKYPLSEIVHVDEFTVGFQLIFETLPWSNKISEIVNKIVEKIKKRPNH